MTDTTQPCTCKNRSVQGPHEIGCALHRSSAESEAPEYEDDAVDWSPKPSADTEMYRLRDLIASHIACEKDCATYPTGCGCALTAARAIVSAPAQSASNPARLLTHYADWIEQIYGSLPRDKAPGPPTMLLQKMRADAAAMAAQPQFEADDGARNAHSTLWSMIAAIYQGLDFEDRAWVDGEWAKMRGYILPPDNSVTLSRSSAGTALEGKRDAIVQAIHAHVGILFEGEPELFGVEDAADAILAFNEPQAVPVTQNAAVLAEHLIQAAVDYEAGRCSKREMAVARAAVEAAIQPLAAPTPAFDAMAAEVIERISERYNKLAASPLGMASAWERKASAGKPYLYGGKRGMLAQGSIATWDEFDLIVDVINNLPTLLAACSVSRPHQAGGSE